jgi:hypothetical protein
MTTETKNAMRTDDGPNVALLIEQLHDTCTLASTAYDDMLRAENTRFCKWDDQQEDGRKPDRVNAKPAKPWPGASDTRQRLADELVVADVRLMKKVARSAKLTVRGTEGGDFAAAGKTQIYLDHLRNVRMRANVANETELAAQWRQTYGYAMTAVTWRREWARCHDPITLEQLQQMALTGQLPAAGTLLALVKSPDRADLREAVRLLQQMYPDLETSEAYEQLQALKTTGRMSMPNRKLVVNRPEWEALKMWRDVFMPLNTANEQRAPWIAWRWTGTAPELEEKALSEGWGEEFIAAVKLTTGKTVLEQLGTSRVGQGRSIFRDQLEEMDGLHEVFYFFYEACDEQGLPCKYRTVLSPHIPKDKVGEQLHGADGPAGFDHGLYPFVMHRRERQDRMAAESRGTPSIVHTNQLEVKWQRDAQVNQTDLALQPPVIRPEREIGLPLNIRPLGEIGQRRQAALQFQPVPPVPPQSTQLEAEARRDAMRYFARNRAEDPVGASLADQDLADDWAAELEQLWRLTLQTAQQFETQLEFQRIVGGQPVPFAVGRDEIQGAHDIQLFFNTDSMDPERMKAKAEIMQKIILPLDRGGVVDWAPVVRGLFGYYLPEFADVSLRSGDQATAAEVKDEANNWGLILGGTEPEMAEQGQNFALRLQWLEAKMKEPGAQVRLMQLPDSGQLAQRRLDHLKFQVQQQQNADTGRKGVAPQPGASAAAV